MVRKDLRGHRTPPLELLWDDGRVFVVQPPNARRGELLAKGIAWGIAAVQHPEQATQDKMAAELGEEYLTQLGGEYVIEKLALGEDTWQEMFDAGLSLVDIQFLARYAAFFWVFGEAAADALDNSPGAAAVPKPSPSGPATESATPSPTAPTAGTRPPKKSAASNGKPAPAAARSPGSRSSSAGR